MADVGLVSLVLDLAALQVGVGVPEAYSLGAGKTDCALCVDIVKRAGESNNSDFRGQFT